LKLVPLELVLFDLAEEDLRAVEIQKATNESK
jgi:hypothetical protein